MTQEQRTPEGRVYTEEEHKYWLGVHLKELTRENNELRAKLKAARFQAAVAEWAVAGVLSKQLSLKVSVSEQSQAQAAIDLARAVGRNAGTEFLNRAELQFTKHAEHSALLMQTPPHVRFNHHSCGPEVTEFYNWPRPFK